jgi:hypothetical protein
MSVLQQKIYGVIAAKDAQEGMDVRDIVNEISGADAMEIK